MQNSEKFQKVTRYIFRYKQQKAKAYVNLNEAKFLKERAGFKADLDEDKDPENDVEQDRAKSYATITSTRSWPSPSIS